MTKPVEIMVVAPTSGSLDGRVDDRFKYIANLMASRGHVVEFVTSDFEHHAKAHRSNPKVEAYRFRTTLLHELGYERNVSPFRILSHSVFAKNLESYLCAIKEPKVIYCAIPPIGASIVAGKYCRSRGVRYVIDVQDLWPESFYPYIRKLPGASVATSLMMKYANKAYSLADEAIAVSQTYADRIASANSSADVHVVYLGSDLSSINMRPLSKKGFEIKLAYIGNLGNSYDFESTFAALEILEKRGSIPKLEFVIIGDGICSDNVRALAKKHYPRTVFKGRLPYEEAFAILCDCDIGINPIRAGRAASIVNKVGDYAAAGLAVINTQDQVEYRNLLEERCIGINTKPECPKSIAEAIQDLYDDGTKRRAMGELNRALYFERFDRKCTYDKIAEILERGL